MKNLRIFSLGASVLSGLIGVLYVFGIVVADSLYDKDVQAFKEPAGGFMKIAKSTLEGLSFSGLDSIVVSTIYVVIGIVLFAGILALTSAINGMVISPKAALAAALGIGLLALVIGGSYLAADGSDYKQYSEVTELTSRLVSTGIYAFYSLFIMAIAAVGFSSLSRLRN
jgi:hypothetical protein